LSLEVMPGPLVARLDAEILRDDRYAREPYLHRVFYETRRYLEYERLVQGNEHTTHPAAHHKWVDLSTFPVPTAERGRRYLTDIFELQRPTEPGIMPTERVPWRREALRQLEIVPPRWFPGGVLEGPDLAYVDLKAAYWQLYHPTTLDLYFLPGPKPTLALGRLAFLDGQELSVDKGLRNSLIGSIQVREFHTIGAQGTARHPFLNRLLAPHLWGYLMYQLHTVAAEVRQRYRAIYVACDGYIVAGDDAADLVDWLMRRWRLPAEIQGRGPGVVYAIGSYQIGDHGTRRAAQGGGARVDNVLPYDSTLAAKLQAWRTWLLEKPPTLWSTTAQLAAAGGQVLRKPPLAPGTALDAGPPPGWTGSRPDGR
jgi:hypothetical protein